MRKWMSHVLVKPTSGPEVGESADMSAPFPPGVWETQSLGRVWGRTCRAPRGRGSASAQTQPRLSSDSCACPAPGGLGPCGRTVWFEPPWVTHRLQRCHPALGGSDHLRSIQFRFPHSEAHVLNVSMRGGLDLGDPVDVTGGSTCSS